jgi:hypothetical protein
MVWTEAPHRCEHFLKIPPNPHTRQVNGIGLRNFNWLNKPCAVTPAKAGVQKYLKSLDTGLRRHDEKKWPSLNLTPMPLTPLY